MNDQNEQLVEVNEQSSDIMPLPDIGRMVARKKAIDSLVNSVMSKDVHYGIIPGCGKKPTLLKPGAEALCVAFNCRPEPVTTCVTLPDDHREYRTTCKLIYISTGQIVGEASATCTTMESKYRFRTGPKKTTCVPVPREYWSKRKTDPRGAQELLGGAGFVAHKEENGNWYIWEKADGTENPNIADTYNTVRRISEKRALVAVTLIAFGVSDKFTQEPENKEKPEDESGATTGTDNASTSQVKTCPKCSKPMEKRSGTKGNFWGCGGYPDCKHTEKIEKSTATEKQKAESGSDDDYNPADDNAQRLDLEIALNELLNSHYGKTSKSKKAFLAKFGGEIVDDLTLENLKKAYDKIKLLIDSQKT